MALLFFEGFETVGSELGIANQATTQPRIELRWDEESHGGVPATDSYFLIDDYLSEDYALQMGVAATSNNNFVAWNIAAGDQTTGGGAKTFIVGCRIHIPSTARTYGFMTARSDANNDTHLFWNIVDSTDLQCVRGPATEIDRVNDVFTPGNWHYVEMKFQIHDTTGIAEAYVDGVLVFSNSGIDTRNFWGTVDQIRFLNTVSAVGEDYTGFDDIYVLKTEGDTPNNYLGLGARIKSLPPNGDDTVEWTVSAGTVHYTLIDENGADSSDYVETDVNTEEEMFETTNMSNGGTLFGIKVEVEAIDTVAGANNMDVRIDSNGTVEETNYNVTDIANYAVFTHYASLDPDTSVAWTSGGIDALKIGAQFNT